MPEGICGKKIGRTDDSGDSAHLRVVKNCDTKCLNRGSYMSAHVLLNLLNELGKRVKMRGLSSILSLFRNEFNKFGV